MTIRRLALLAALAAFATAISACESDRKKAKITSFTASPSLLPTLGGETTLTWNVKGAESLEIEPDIGAVTGSSLTLTLTEGTTFTLTARRDGRVTRRTTTVTLAPPGAVVGVVRSNPARILLPSVAVFCNGQATVTDDNGMFLFEDVPTPYDISLFDPNFPFAMIWEGLTRLDPILEIPGLTMGDPYDVSIAGTATPATADPDTTTNVAVKSAAYFFPSTATADGLGAWNTFAGWYAFDTDPEDVAAIAVRYITDPVTDVVTFTHFGRTDLSVDPLGAPVTGVSIPLSPVDNAVATGQFVFDPGEELAFLVPTMILDSATGATSDAGFTLPNSALVLTTAFAFTLATPDLNGSAVLWSAYEETAIGAFGYRPIRLTPGAQNVQVDFPQLPRLLSPVDQGTVDRETFFQMASLPDSAKIWGFNSSDVVVLVVTNRDRLQLPELAEAGIVFPEGAQIDVSVIEITPFPSTDELAGPDGLFGAAPDLFGFSENRQVYLDDLP